MYASVHVCTSVYIQVCTCLRMSRSSEDVIGVSLTIIDRPVTINKSFTNHWPTTNSNQPLTNHWPQMNQPLTKHWPSLTTHDPSLARGWSTFSSTNIPRDSNGQGLADGARPNMNGAQGGHRPGAAKALQHSLWLQHVELLFMFQFICFVDFGAPCTRNHEIQNLLPSHVNTALFYSAAALASSHQDLKRSHALPLRIGYWLQHAVYTICTVGSLTSKCEKCIL